MFRRFGDLFNRRCKFIFALFCLILISSAFAAEVNYSYDDLGRLIKIERGLERTLYQYDDAGNVISITKEICASQPLPPVLQGIEPDIFLIGNNYNVSITGQNLLTTSSVTSDNPNIIIKNVIPTDTKIFATISISSGASHGAADITVTTSYGTASMSINLYKVVIDPKTMLLFLGRTQSISVSLTPPAPEDLGVSIFNNNPDIINAPLSLVIPAGRSAAFTVNALKAGTGRLNIGNEMATVFVMTGDYFINAAPLSVGFGSVQARITSANPVSVGWPVSMNSLISTAVSVGWSTVSSGIVISDPVCVKIGN